MNFIPKAEEIGKEALIVILGAMLAAFIVGQFPAVKVWMKDQWDGAGRKIGN